MTDALTQTLGHEFALHLKAVMEATDLPSAFLALHRARIVARAGNHELEPYLIQLEAGNSVRPESALQELWFEAWQPHRLNQLVQSELRQRLELLQAASNSEAARREVHRARVALQSAGLVSELTIFLSQLAAGQTPVSASPETVLWLGAWNRFAHVSFSLDPDAPKNWQLVFTQELAQRLTALRQAKDPKAMRLEIHRLRVAARAIQDGLEPELKRLEFGETNTVTDSRLKAALPVTRASPELVTRASSEPVTRASPEPVTRASPQPAVVRPENTRLDSAPTLVSQSIMPPMNRSTDQNATLEGSNRAVAQESVRVSVARLDSLLAQAGELTVGRIRIEERLRDLRDLLGRRNLERRNSRHSRTLRRRLQGLADENRDVAAVLGLLETSEENTRRALDKLEDVLNRLSGDLAQLRTVNTTIEDEVLSVRLLPAAMLFPPLERLVRDLGQQLGKQVRLITLGGGVGIDRKILEGLRDPLMHMIRNAVDHGLELPNVRGEFGKPSEGTITLSVNSSGGMVTLNLSDDGNGMDASRILKKAEEKGIIQSALTYDPKLALDLIFEPGFSTAAAVTDVSGRGVGMDVVRQNIRALSGTVSVQSQLGAGSHFVMRVPAQLATVRVLLVRVGHDTFAVPTASIERTGRVKVEGIHQLEGRSVIILEGRPIPLVELGSVMDVPFEAGESWQPYFILRRDDDRLSCTVDAMLGEQEVVVKKLSYPLEKFAALEGAAVLGSGQLVSILSSTHLIERGLRREIRVRRDLKIAPTVAARVPRIMVVDDSITSRTLERSILEAAGFETITAVHGAQALEFLRRGEHVDLVVSDVEMPELDGFGLTGEIRRDPRLAQIPVILITSLNAPEHKERGAMAGADAYIVKGEFDQGVLLETINRLL
jgi:two-component system, chemotaxis family, sensor kinase CheA